MHKNCRDLTNRRFGRLTAVSPTDERIRKNVVWICQCDCGNQTRVPTSYLNSGNTRSCGCLQRETTARVMRVHGLTDTRLHRIWRDMRKRCQNPNHKSYNNYGGRGIRVCDQWAEFMPFRDWAVTHGYRSDLSIDRINNDGGYTAENCRWAGHHQQARNRRSSKLTFADAQAIRRDPRPLRAIAADYLVSGALVGQIKRGEKWPNVDSSNMSAPTQGCLRS